jgi:hypothetical protein
MFCMLQRSPFNCLNLKKLIREFPRFCSFSIPQWYEDDGDKHKQAGPANFVSDWENIKALMTSSFTNDSVRKFSGNHDCRSHYKLNNPKLRVVFDVQYVLSGVFF